MHCGGGESLLGAAKVTRDVTGPLPGFVTNPVLMLCCGLTETWAQKQKELGEASSHSQLSRTVSPRVFSVSDEEDSSWEANDFLLGIFQFKKLTQPACSPGPCLLRPGQRTCSSVWLLPINQTEQSRFCHHAYEPESQESWRFLAHRAWSFQIWEKPGGFPVIPTHGGPCWKATERKKDGSGEKHLAFPAMKERKRI